jgi:hypothetical protein
MQGCEAREFWLLRRYLKEANVSRELFLRTLRYCEHAWQQRGDTVNESDVKLLNFMSTPLREEIKTESFAQHLQIHPFIGRLQYMIRGFARVFSPMELGQADIVFAAGETAHAMFFVSGGECKYVCAAGDDFDTQDLELVRGFSTNSACAPFSNLPNLTEMDIEKGVWLSEQALWAEWHHHGDLEAAGTCFLIAIDAAAFVRIVSQNVSAWEAARAYAVFFIAEMNKTSSMTDIVSPCVCADASGLVENKHLLPRAKKTGFTVHRFACELRLFDAF